MPRPPAVPAPGLMATPPLTVHDPHDVHDPDSLDGDWVVGLCLLNTAAGIRPALARLARLACRAVRGADAASVTVGSPIEPLVITSSAAPAQLGDALQIRATAGPSLDAFRLGSVVETGDLLNDRRWPGVHGLGDETPVRACAAAALTAGSAVLGVLTLYSTAADGLAARPALEPLTARAVALVLEAERFAERDRTVGQLTTALESRPVIDQAKGIIMARDHCDQDEAFRQLCQVSSTTNRKVRDVARELVARATL